MDIDYRPLIDRLVAAGRADERVLAVLLYGSHASGQADAYSDLDVGLVTTDGGYEEVVSHAADFVEVLGRPLLLEDFGNPANVHAILADGSMLELIIARSSELSIEGPHRVLLDKGGIVDVALARESPAAESPAPSDEVRRLVAWFWHDVEHLTVALGRGQPMWAHGQLEELRAVCLHLARIAAGITDEDEPYWKVDSVLDDGVLSALRTTVVPTEPGPMREAALALVRLYRALAQPLLSHYEMAYPTELDRLMTARLEE